MGRLLYSAIASLDGFTADRDGGFDWAAPDADVHAAANELEGGIGTHLLGRRMYETLSFWEELPPGDQPAEILAYHRLWRATDKIVFSRTLGAPSTERTRLERDFDPGAVRDLVASAARDVAIGGPGLAAHALAAGLVDELQLFTVPVVVGGGTRWLPDGFTAPLELREHRVFADGTTLHRYVLAR